jgi:Fe2+ transport system protein FeoA
VTERLLNQCKRGDSGILYRIEGNTPLLARLQELGMVPGEWVRILQAGNPIILQVGDSRLCVRAQELDGVSVIPISKTEEKGISDPVRPQEMASPSEMTPQPVAGDLR